MDHSIKIIPLGGVHEIGKNMTVIQYNDDIVVVDCGMSFPDEEMPGIDVVIPDMSFLSENKDKIKCFLITHGHEDHIGALPFALEKFNVPVYGTAFTIELIRHKLEEKQLNTDNLICIQPGDSIHAGVFDVEFIKTGHSIAGSVALAINTPIGTVMHTGDFKIDLTPIDKEPIDLNRFAYYGTKGVFALLSDSTNVERSGYTESEQEIGKTFSHYFENAKGRIIVASFASNVYRIQQVADYALKHDRVICFQGRSMLQVVDAAIKLGYLHIPNDRIISVESISGYPDNRICVITTGSQGEAMSSLYRMANNTHKLNVGKGDLVIISASAIPGNEVGVSKIIDKLLIKGCEVIYDSKADVHVSGHACREELRLMLSLIKPKYFIPVHGEYRHLYEHKNLAMEMGLEESNIFLCDNGDVVELSKESGIKEEKVTAGSVMVDGIGDIDDIVLKDRLELSEDGLVVVFITIDIQSAALLSEPQIISRGFVYMRQSEELISQMTELVTSESDRFNPEKKDQYQDIKNSIRSKLKSLIKKETKRSPMIIVVLQEI